MVMRYHWGRAVGHTYAYFSEAQNITPNSTTTDTTEIREDGLETDVEREVDGVDMELNDNGEMEWEDGNDDREDSEEDDDMLGANMSDESEEDDSGDENELLDMYEMYGDSQCIEYYD
jgi:hypothetical protein